MHELAALLLAIVGLLLLASPALPVGLLLLWGAYQVYARRRRGDQRLAAVLTVLGGLGAAALYVRAALERFT